MERLGEEAVDRQQELICPVKLVICIMVGALIINRRRNYNIRRKTATPDDSTETLLEHSDDEYFQDDVSELKPYNPAQHLAEMIALLGPVPERLVQREREMRHWRWSPEVRNVEGKLCSNAAEYFGGPFLTDNGMWSLQPIKLCPRLTTCL